MASTIDRSIGSISILISISISIVHRYHSRDCHASYHSTYPLTLSKREEPTCTSFLETNHRTTQKKLFRCVKPFLYPPRELLQEPTRSTPFQLRTDCSDLREGYVPKTRLLLLHIRPTGTSVLRFYRHHVLASLSLLRRPWGRCGRMVGPSYRCWSLHKKHCASIDSSFLQSKSLDHFRFRSVSVQIRTPSHVDMWFL
jgi:hypothetical protein